MMMKTQYPVHHRLKAHTWLTVALLIGFILSYISIRWFVVQSNSRLMQTINVASRVNDVAFSPTGELLGTVHEDGSLSIWQVNTGKLMYTIQTQQGSATTLVMSHDGQWVASGGDGQFMADSAERLAPMVTKPHHAVNLWSLADGRLIQVFDCPVLKRATFALAISADQQYLTAGGSEGGDLYLAYSYW